nr:immunoglobulin heavy chain junction region [Mus musculus]
YIFLCKKGDSSGPL